MARGALPLVAWPPALLVVRSFFEGLRTRWAISADAAQSDAGGCRFTRPQLPDGLTAFLYQRHGGYCIADVPSRWDIGGAKVCGAGGR